MADIIQIRRDTAANWTAADPILALGEMGVETDTLKFKLGDGTTVWSGLDYIINTGNLAETNVAETITAAWEFTGGITLGEYTEGTHILTGSTPAIDPANGTIQTWTLIANSTPTSGLTDGQSVTLMIDDGTGFTITWTMVDQWIGGSAPTLATTGFTVVNIWRVGSLVYGALIGELS